MSPVYLRSELMEFSEEEIVDKQEEGGRGAEVELLLTLFYSG